MPSIRIALALLAVVVLTGCIGGPVADPQGTVTTNGPPSGTATTPTDATTTNVATDAPTTTRDCYYRAFEVEVRPISADGVATEQSVTPSRLEFEARQVFEAAASNGSATATVLDDELPLDRGTVVMTDDGYYRVEAARTGSESVTADVFEVGGPLDPDYDDDDYSRAEREAVSFDDLTAADRAAFLAGLPGGERLDGLVEGGGSMVGQYDYAYPNATARNASHLVEDGPHYVSFRDTYWRIAPDGQRRTTQSTYRYALERVATSSAAYGRQVLDRDAVDLSESFAGDQRSLLLEAVDRGTLSWSGCEESPPPGYKGLFATVGDLPPNGNLAYVSYGGTVYRVTVVQMVE